MKPSVRKLTSLAMLAAISIVMVYLVRIPMFVPFLEYDPADIPILIATFAYGPVTGLLLTIVVSVIQGLTVSAVSGPIGIFMHIFATGCYVLVAGLIYRKYHTRKAALSALAIGSVVMTAAMVVWNLIMTPIFMGTPVDAVAKMLVPAIIPFNLIKAAINGTVTFLLYKSIAQFIKGAEKPAVCRS